MFKLSEEEHVAFSSYYKYIINKQEINGKEDLAFKKSLDADIPIIDYIDKIKEKGINILVYYGQSDPFNYKVIPIEEENKEEISTEKRLVERGINVKTIERGEIIIYFDNPKKIGELLKDDIQKKSK